MVNIRANAAGDRDLNTMQNFVYRYYTQFDTGDHYNPIPNDIRLSFIAQITPHTRHPHLADRIAI